MPDLFTYLNRGVFRTKIRHFLSTQRMYIYTYFDKSKFILLLTILCIYSMVFYLHVVLEVNAKLVVIQKFFTDLRS